MERNTPTKKKKEKLKKKKMGRTNNVQFKL